MQQYIFPVEAGQVMLFARAVGDPNPVYYDAEAAKDSEVGGIIAPPTFVQAGSQYDPYFPLRPRIGEPWFGSGREATGTQVSQTQGGGTALHGEQHYTYHRPLRPGDVLTVTHEPGMTWEKTNRSGATLFFSEVISEYQDTRGEPVVTARAVIVRTERPAEEGT